MRLRGVAADAVIASSMTVKLKTGLVIPPATETVREFLGIEILNCCITHVFPMNRLSIT